MRRHRRAFAGVTPRALAPIACASARPRAERPVPSANAPGGRGFGRDLTPLPLPQVVGIVIACCDVATTEILAVRENLPCHSI